jgi:SNF2 family DNA or RNA helicase
VLLNWAAPNQLGSISSWRKLINDPIRIGNAHGATPAEMSRGRRAAERLVNVLLPQFFLRRDKSLIASELPKKTDRVVFCPLADGQEEAYKNFAESAIVEWIKEVHQPCTCNSGKSRGWCCYAIIPEYGSWQSFVFPCIHTLSKIANHVALLVPPSLEPKDKQERAIRLLKIACPKQWESFVREQDNVIKFADAQLCGKWQILRQLLNLWHHDGHKVLVFSHSVRLLTMLHWLFSREKYSISFLSGQMSNEQRKDEVAEFNANPDQFVFLISTKAGGVGL